MDKNICLFLLPNLFIICRSWPAAACNSGGGDCGGDCDGRDYNNKIIHELIEFDRLLKLEKFKKIETNLPNNYQGIIIFINGENFSHYYECHVENYNMKWQIVNKETELDELFNFLGLETHYLNQQSLISELSSAIDDEYGIYSSYKVKYDYDFDTHVYKSRNDIDSDLHFLIDIFKKNI